MFDESLAATSWRATPIGDFSLDDDDDDDGDDGGDDDGDDDYLNLVSKSFHPSSLSIFLTSILFSPWGGVHDHHL